jgi:DNA primase
MSDDILQIAHQHLRKVKKSGNEDIMAVCPFHRKMDGTEEKNPSFSMNVFSGLWYCHSCHARGNLYSFLRDVGLPRGEIEMLYKGIIEEAEKYAPKKYDPLNVTEPTTDVLPESFLGLFDQCPVQLLEEGYPEDLLRKFDVGYDAVHNRITFPLRDWRGRLIGISGRATREGQNPRYKVYDWEYKDYGMPERATQKRALLWNAHKVLPQLLFTTSLADRYVVLSEGFKAVMRITQAGISNVVGLLGSYMSKEQQQLIENMGCTVILMLDNNDAGQRGQLDAGLRLVKTVERLYVATYDGSQPSELQLPAITDSLLGAQSFQRWFVQQSTLQPS